MLEFSQHLRVGLGPRHTAIELYDVAELTRERAPARILHANVKVLVEFEQVEARQRCLGDVDLKFLRLENAGTFAALPSTDEILDNVLGLAEHLEVGRTV